MRPPHIMENLLYKPPRLEMAQEKGLLIVAYATHKLKDFFFFLIQSEYLSSTLSATTFIL